MYRKILLFVPVVLLMITAGCHPYYNTFYNAEEAYMTAQRDHKKAMRVFPDSIVVTPPSRSVAQYNRAIDKSLKMMEVFPNEKKRLDRAYYLMGRASFYKLDFPVCLGRMQDLQTMFPNSPLIPMSRLYSAKAHIMTDNLTIAEDILLELLREHPRLDKNHEITMLLVEIALRRGGRSQALGILDGINLSTLPLFRRLDIILRMADLNIELRRYEEALALLQNAPRTRKHPYLMYRIDRAVYFCHDAMDSLDTALDHLTAMQKNRRYADQRYEIMFYRAVTLRRMGRFEEAIALFDAIMAMCAGTGGFVGKADTATLCGRSAYDLALIYQEMGQYDKAMEMFEEAEKRGGGRNGMASAKLIALRRLKELRTPDSDGKVPITARYTIAELFRFELEAPDSAYIFYMEIAAAEPTDSADVSYRPRALLSAAVVARYQLYNENRADSLFRLVLAEYAGTEFARLAQIELDMEITVVTARELAERDFRTAEAMLENDPVEAIKAFYNVHIDHPEMDAAPRSLHAAAWYTDHILQRNRAAMTLYEELCEKYPESEYCKNSATPRLKIARDSIEVRRRRREAADSVAAGMVDSTGVAGDSTAVGADTVPAAEIDPGALLLDDGVERQGDIDESQGESDGDRQDGGADADPKPDSGGDQRDGGQDRENGADPGGDGDVRKQEP